ncbi:hypothetical protein BGZ61DRAFT_443114 [Ilyonectria robusta]|uniref:uncharacterized protein n=1 Tax=Ilyonectria robusta TaxID=1079257 RepID=UPI001E8CC217|nr:uncharacterized protein BGZ61DRAFT_443114 [Ilyonectria robusta]KAH8734777.1 hypothetical protein BGZ61DRAFT_443114 [Ilyonectria robusta]
MTNHKMDTGFPWLIHVDHPSHFAAGLHLALLVNGWAMPCVSISSCRWSSFSARHIEFSSSEPVQECPTRGRCFEAAKHVLPTSPAAPRASPGLLSTRLSTRLLKLRAWYCCTLRMYDDRIRGVSLVQCRKEAQPTPSICISLSHVSISKDLEPRQAIGLNANAKPSLMQL